MGTMRSSAFSMWRLTHLYQSSTSSTARKTAGMNSAGKLYEGDEIHLRAGGVSHRTFLFEVCYGLVAHLLRLRE